MNILSGSIKNFGCNLDAIYDLSGRISGTAPVDLTIRSFRYEQADEAVVFSLQDLKSLFCELLPSPNKKRGEFSCEIAGIVEKISHEQSREIISNYIYCGSLAGDFLASRSDISLELREQSENNVLFFWRELGKAFTMPPTHAYVHTPSYGTCFAEGSIWNFCHIYLNDITKEGVLLAGECSFD